MDRQFKISEGQKQMLKKYGVFLLMGIICAGSLWLIFTPSGADKAKEQQGMGFNPDIPEPGGGGLIGDKKNAYQQEQMQSKQQERMQSLQLYMDMLADGAKQGQDGEPQQEGLQPSQQAPVNNSVSAYRDINRTLGSFYEKPKDDPEKEVMKKKLEELEARMREKEDKQDMIDGQLMLMEKSYEMAAKYLPQGQDGQNNSLKNKIENYSGNPSNGKTKVSPVRQVQQQTVSALGQNISNEELLRMYDQPRNTGFNTMDGEAAGSIKNTIAAVVHDDQTVIDGQTTRLRLTEPLVAGTTLIPENTIVTGVAKVQGERLDILVSSIEYRGTVIPVEMAVYDSDGQKGINIPGSLELNAAKEIVANMGGSLGTSFTMTQSTGAQLASDLSKGAIQGVSAYMQKKIKLVKVTLKSGYKVMLMPKQ